MHSESAGDRSEPAGDRSSAPERAISTFCALSVLTAVGCCCARLENRDRLGAVEERPAPVATHSGELETGALQLCGQDIVVVEHQFQLFDDLLVGALAVGVGTLEPLARVERAGRSRPSATSRPAESTPSPRGSGPFIRHGGR